MEDSSYEHEYYLDLETGEILFLSDYMDDEETEKLRDRIDEEPDRYEQIPKTESHEGYEDMQDFIATVEDEHLAELLDVAINVVKEPFAGSRMCCLAILRKGRGGLSSKTIEYREEHLNGSMIST